MSKWITYRLEQLAEKIGIGPFGSSIKVDTFVSNGIPVISGGHLKGIRLEDNKFNFVSVEHADRLKNANVYRGDVVFTHAGNIGAVAYIPNTSKYERYILSQRQFYLRCDRSKLLPEYITYYFKSPEGQHKLLANASSVGVPSIAKPVTYLKSIELDIPEIEEQIEIVGILSSLDDRIELNQQMNQTMENIAQTVFLKHRKEEK
jgi:type I restriction enzyme S subunit